MTGEKDKFKTQEKLWKIDDETLKTPAHDELVLSLTTKWLFNILPDAIKLFRAYVSLTNDRGDGGYRSTVAVLANPALRATLLDEALAEFARWETKYHSIQELGDIFAAAHTVKQRQALLESMGVAETSITH